MEVTEGRTKADWAHAIQRSVGVCYPQAKRTVPVRDNINTHTPEALYEVFPTAEAKSLADKLEIHHSLNHGSWLNTAENGTGHPKLAVLKPAHFRDAPALISEASAWQERREAKGGKIDRRFSTADVRIKVKHLYP